MPKKVKQVGHQIKFEAFKAEHLAPLDSTDIIGPSSTIQAYCQVKYG